MIEIKAFSDNGVCVAFNYDPIQNKLFLDGQEVLSISGDAAANSKPCLSVIQIVLGHECNLSCSYCAQCKSPMERNIDVKKFVRLLERYTADVDVQEFVFLGGETLLYFNEIQDMHKELVQNWPDAVYKITSNGTLFTEKICDWCVDNQIMFTLSHDGPGQFVRGVDPLENKVTLKTIQKYVTEMGVLGIAPVLTKYNSSFSLYLSFLSSRLDLSGCGLRCVSFSPMVAANEGARNLLVPNTELLDMAENLLHEFSTGTPVFGALDIAVCGFLSNLGTTLNYKQRCVFDHPSAIAVDINGRRLKCALFSEFSEPVSTIEGRHVSERPQFDWSSTVKKFCSGCLVFHLCQGGCPCVPKNYFLCNCEQSYYFYLTALISAVQKMTGLTVPITQFSISQAVKNRSVL